jgi:hypothetical protein
VSGVAKVHYISARYPLRGAKGECDAWEDYADALFSHLCLDAVWVSFVFIDTDRDEVVWTVGVPEGHNASQFYLTYMRDARITLDVDEYGTYWCPECDEPHEKR